MVEVTEYFLILHELAERPKKDAKRSQQQCRNLVFYIQGEIVLYIGGHLFLQVLWQPLVTKTNRNTNNKSFSRISSRDHKRTQQRVSAGLLPYLYKLHMVHATNNYSCSNVHALSMSVYHIVAMHLTCSLILFIWTLLVCSSLLQAYDLTSCDKSCDHGHMPIYCQKRKRNSKEKKYKIDKRKRKMLVLMHIIIIGKFRKASIYLSTESSATSKKRLE